MSTLLTETRQPPAAGPLAAAAEPLAAAAEPLAAVAEPLAAAAEPLAAVAEPLAAAAEPLDGTPFSYPPELAVKLSDKTFTAEDYPALRARYGKYVVLLLRDPEARSISACFAVISIVKMGIMGRHTKVIPAGAVAGFLPEFGLELEMMAVDGQVLVCSPPLDAGMAATLADIAMSEECFFATKLSTLTALDTVLGFTPDRVVGIVTDMIRYLGSETFAYRSRIEQVEPPTGEWNIYTRGGGIPPPDRLTNAIKGFANYSTRVFPPLPPVDSDEVDALLTAHDMLVLQGMGDLAFDLITTALRSPMFARLCHRPEIFAGDRSPRLKTRGWKNFGAALLGYLFSEEVTHAARRNVDPSPVTLAAPYVLTLKEVVAMGVPHAPRDEAHGFERLNAYVGGYLAELDLSRTLITGSAIAAALIVTNVERGYYEGSSVPRWMRQRDVALRAARAARAPSARAPSARVSGVRPSFHPGSPVESDDESDVESDDESDDEKYPDYDTWRAKQLGAGYESYLAAHYAPTKTVPRDRGAYLAATALFMKGKGEREATHSLAVTPIPGGHCAVLTLEVTCTAHDHSGVQRATAVLDVVGGADLDMSVDVETNDEFDAVAQAHYAVIHARFPEAILTKVLREDPTDPRYNWSITCPWDPSFRQVEMYRANFNHVVTHHVGMVSGAFTAIFGGPPQFVMSSRLALSMANLGTPNYYYFASRKTTPQHVVLKYLMRGFNLDGFPPGIERAIRAAASQDPLWSGDDEDEDLGFPALFGKGNFSAFSIAAELEALNADKAARSNWR